MDLKRLTLAIDPESRTPHDPDYEFAGDFYLDLDQVVEDAGARFMTPEEIEAGRQSAISNFAGANERLIATLMQMLFEISVKLPPELAEQLWKAVERQFKNPTQAPDPQLARTVPELGHLARAIEDRRKYAPAARIAPARVPTFLARPRESRRPCNARRRGSRRGAATRTASRGGDSGDGDPDPPGDLGTPPARRETAGRWAV